MARPSLVSTEDDASVGRNGRTLFGRADLVYCYAREGKKAVDAVAHLAVYTRRESEQVSEPTPEVSAPKPTGDQEPPAENTQPEVQAQIPVRYWTVVDRYIKEPDEIQTKVPQEVRDAKPADRALLTAKSDRPPPPHQDLVPWSRVWPCLRTILALLKATKEPHPTKAVDHVARLGSMDRLPRRHRARWASPAVILVDRAEHLEAYAEDVRLVIERLVALRSQEGLTVLYADDGPEQPLRDWFNPLDQPKKLTTLPIGTPFLVLGDLGLLHQNDQAHGPWLRLGRRLARFGVRPTVLLPAMPATLPDAIQQTWCARLWDGRPARVRTLSDETQQQAVEQLLALMSIAPRVSYGLLRALRGLIGHGDARLETLISQHPQVAADGLGVAVAGAKTVEYSEAFELLEPTLQDAALEHIKAHCVELPMLYLNEVKRATNADTQKPRGQTYAEDLAPLIQSLRNQDANAPYIRAYVGRLANRLPSSRWAFGDYAVLYRLAFPDKLLPEGIDPATIAWVDLDDAEPKTYTLVQRSTTLHLEGAGRASRHDASGVGYPLGKITGRGDGVYVNGWNQPFEQPILLDGETITLKTTDETLKLANGDLPGEGNGGVDQKGIYLVTQDGKRINRPEWAVGFGRDDYGVYAEAQFKDVRWTMRLIPSGTFMMGSPEDEPERGGGEILHQVTLTQAYWMAETACTQTLWEAVTGNNPSRSTGDSDLPVDTVSWEDVQEFLERLGVWFPDASFRLPSEAEWEYACRAGSQTPFSFGDQLTTELANYDGKLPYAGAARGEYRKQTLPAKSFDPNPWGLYQMHGNVYEWCQDWYGHYQSGEQIDPTGPGRGERRVMRGGSWDSGGRFLRSAYRVYFDPADRGYRIGFRFAGGPVKEEEAAFPFRQRTDAERRA